MVYTLGSEWHLNLGRLNMAVLEDCQATRLTTRLFGPMLVGITKCDEALPALIREADSAWPIVAYRAAKKQRHKHTVV